jgi:hypothetical protein
MPVFHLLHTRPRSNSRRAVEARVRRRLARDGQALGKCPENSRWRSDLGDYFVTDAATRFTVRTHLCLDDLAREVGALRPTETIAE